jgi:signal transduction histidine kinase
MNNSPESATPEQKLSILTNELRTPVEIIRGFASVIRMEIESDRINPAELLNEIITIAEAANKIKELLDEMVSS